MLYKAFDYRHRGSIRRYFTGLLSTPIQHLEVLDRIGCQNTSCPKRLHLQELKSTLADDEISEARLSAEDIRLLFAFEKVKLCSG
jgi:hypothetical protein